MASGSATNPTVTPARVSAANFGQLYSFKHEIDLGSHSCIDKSSESELRLSGSQEGKTKYSREGSKREDFRLRSFVSENCFRLN